jgi:hypothetical protein
MDNRIGSIQSKLQKFGWIKAETVTQKTCYVETRPKNSVEILPRWKQVLFKSSRETRYVDVNHVVIGV